MPRVAARRIPLVHQLRPQARKISRDGDGVSASRRKGGGCRFGGCRFGGCRFGGCRFGVCRFGVCRFSVCRFSVCRFSVCRFSGCRFSGCRFGGCRFGGCRFGGCRFGGCRFGVCHFGVCRLGAGLRGRSRPGLGSGFLFGRLSGQQTAIAVQQVFQSGQALRRHAVRRQCNGVGHG
ncbi:pentapeptide repeat-containing protein [Pollutimonas bauzanensis]|uniref:pentapeptide repeat-containing protein n=1 Tax=Pollutimonas bauzanensis TaxID=658167 RepID=UPI0015B3C8E1